MSRALRIVFAGTPEFAVPSLAALLQETQVLGVYTQPDRPAGRGRKLRPSSVKTLAEHHGLSVFQPLSLKSSQAQEELSALEPDVLVVVAYGLILPEAILDTPRLGCINVHGSLLPRWRGAAPVQRAILAGDLETGVTIMQMERGLDTGPMLQKRATKIRSGESAGELTKRLSQLGAIALIDSLKELQRGESIPVSQDDKDATYAAKISKQEAQLDFGESAKQLALKVRAFNPSPVAFTFLDGGRVRIWEAEVVKKDVSNRPPGQIFTLDDNLLVATGQHALAIRVIQPAGGRPMSGSDYLNARDVQGQVFGVF